MVAIMVAGCQAQAGQAIVPGQLVAEAPTLHCLGVRWYVTGDAEGNGSVQVTYRAKGEKAWRKAVPLFRVGTGPDSQEGEKRLATEWDEGWPFPIGNLFAGSIVDLQPDTPTR